VSKRRLLDWVGVLIWLGLLFQAMLYFDARSITPLPNAKLIGQISYCIPPDCDEPQSLTLPFFSPERYYEGVETHKFSYEFDLEQPTSQIQALYFPKFSDHLDVFVNGALLHQATTGRRLWNEPLRVRVSPELLQIGPNRIDLTLTGVLLGRLDLFPFYLGDLATIEGPYQNRFLLGPGLSRMVLAFLAVLSVAFFFVWASRRADKSYLWICLSCLAAGIFVGINAYPVPLGNYRWMKVIETAGMSAYVLFMLKFIRLYLAVPPLRIEQVHMLFLMIGTAAIALVPMPIVERTSLFFIMIPIVSALTLIQLMWAHRAKVSRVDFAIFFGAFSLAFVLAIDGLLLTISRAPPRSINLFHIMPLLTAFVCAWLILSQLIKSLTSLTDLSATQQAKIDETSRQLKESFAKLAAVERLEAINAERGRIMLDLHDGIGGQLVNTLAYIENNNIQDDVLQNSLEDALRDLALMLDSLQNDDSLTTLLGMLRTRLEGLLAKHGIIFDWQIRDEPHLPRPSPSGSLHVARIVQEAITNVIKHANATTITVYADQYRIAVSDDGRGFEVPKSENQTGIGYGILGMKRRAEAIGAGLQIVSTASSTSVTLEMAEAL
tara:strand:- start:1690 stop:3507 length:1818 start_codon:yes stop_codon:yes gene_type:complete